MRSVTIRNGVVTDWGGDAVIDHLDAFDPLISDLLVTRNRIGISLRGQQVSIRDCNLRENEPDGIIISNGTIDRCTVFASRRVGIDATNAVIRSCLSRANPQGFENFE